MSSPRPRQPSAFRQGDVTKTVKAVVAAGLRVIGVKVDAEGKIEVMTAEAVDSQSIGGNEWDRA
jgi:hypothetical protein